MRTKLVAAAVLIATTRGAGAICTAAADAPKTLALRGSIVSCRSAVPDITAALEASRESHEAWAQPLRDHLENADRLWILRPYDEIVADHLAHIEAVIVTFAIEDRLEIQPARHSPAWIAADGTTTEEFLLNVDSSSCDRAPIGPTIEIVPEFECCDPGSTDSCRLHLQAASLSRPKRSIGAAPPNPSLQRTLPE